MQAQCAVEYTAVAGIFAVCQVTSIKFRKNALASQCIFLLFVPYIYILVYMTFKMAASAKALSCPSDSEARSLRTSSRSLTQKRDGGDKSSSKVKNRKNGKKSVGKRIGDGIEDMIEGEIGEGVGGVAAGGRSDGIGEGTEDRVGDSCCEDVKEGEGSEDGDVRCLCARSVERGDMVCCDVCGSWSHLSCIGVKAGVSLMEGKDFVCFFCISTCLLALRKEVGGLREEMEVMRRELKVTREENEKLKCLEGMVQRGSEKLEVNEKEGPVDAGVEGELVTEDKVRKTDGENQTRCQQSQSAGNQRSEQQLNKEGHKQKRKGAGMSKWVAGVRKIWGTRKKESCDDIAKGLVRAVGKMSSGFSVGKRVGQVNGKSGWWFIVRAPESCLLEVDKKWNHKYWRWQLVQRNESTFLGVGPVSARHR